MLRVSVFPSDPNFLFVYRPGGGAVAIPELTAPFTYESVSTAFRAAGVVVRLSEDHVGKHMRELMVRRQLEEKAERRAKAKAAEAFAAALAKGSESTLARDRGELVVKKQKIDAECSKLRAELSAAKSLAFTTGVYAPREEFQAQQARISALASESQAIQAQLTRLRLEEKAANIAAARSSAEESERAFIEAARVVLDKATYMRVWAEVEARRAEAGAA
jgi:hypothetical protein